MAQDVTNLFRGHSGTQKADRACVAEGMWALLPLAHNSSGDEPVADGPPLTESSRITSSNKTSNILSLCRPVSGSAPGRSRDAAYQGGDQCEKNGLLSVEIS